MATTLKTTPDPVLTQVEGAIAYLTLNRPEKRNALSEQLMERLTAALREMGKNPDVQVVVIRAGGSVFSAGHDLNELVGRTVTEYRRVFDACTELMETIQQIWQPVIAQVQGPATAAGCQLVATCDLAVAAESAWFATPGVKIGLFCSTPMVALTRAVGRKRAMEMLLTGERVSASEAVAIGLINKVVPGAQLDSAVRALAAKITESSPNIVSLGKESFYRQIDLPQHDAYSYAAEVMTFNAMMADAHEGITAFLNKRKPNWPRR